MSSFIAVSLRAVSKMLKIRKYLILSLAIAALYLIIYFFATQMLIYSAEDFPFSVKVLDDWQDKVFRLRAPYNWEPMGIVSLGKFRLFLAVPNILIGIFIALLVGINLSLAVFTFNAPKICRISPAKGILSSLPALLAGFACCAPVLLLALGIFSAAITASFIALLPFFIPASLLALLLSLAWSSWKIDRLLQTAKLK